MLWIVGYCWWWWRTDRKIRVWWWWRTVRKIKTWWWWCYWWWCCRSKVQSVDDDVVDRKFKVLMMMLLIESSKCWWWCCWSKFQSANDDVVDRKFKVLMMMLLIERSKSWWRCCWLIERSKCCCCWRLKMKIEDEEYMMKSFQWFIDVSPWWRWWCPLSLIVVIVDVVVEYPSR